MTGVELRGVTTRFDGEPAVSDVELTVQDGELLVLVGPSGCGKTTLLRTIAGLETPDEGEVYVDGARVTDRPARERDVALMFQEYALFPHLTVRENVAFNRRMRGASDVDERVAETVAMLDIEDLLDRDVETLSGGQKQRVALGRAIADDPAAFLLDEPLANLDAGLRERMQTELGRLVERLGITTVHVTHDQREAMTMGDRVAVMRDGTILQVGTPAEIYRRPASLFVARFVGSPTMNCVDGRIDPDSGSVEVGPNGGTSLPIDVADPEAVGERQRVVIGVRPEHVGVGADADARDATAAQVTYVQLEGADAFVHLDSAVFGDLVARVRADEVVDRGERVGLEIDPDDVHVFDAETGERIE